MLSSTRTAASALLRQTCAAPCASSSSAVTCAAARRYASGGSHYNQPSGYLFGEKPPPKGQKREKEDWENIWMYGMFGGMAFAGVVLLYRPDTTIQTATMGEAKKRLAESGEVWQYKPSANSSYPNGINDK
ncbi:hypothetical protein OC834_000827 [Tilletia horrida]|uniref:NADH dehydrogenase [ubiquinone] 1 beta subcomplex subunit 11, mitochondrial n=1 Tax=Tilletia horrida TaxID=155126 RepID=A0AAN6GKL2_9BASI|nr:hypothetical protein OC835_002918 [Tilletia horrida]KAK0537383.1 hypothetical protein OC834_000827 [Tilletia horrida]KAK0541332.1 hypothetical protein OC842_000037 [Tilletia horrida]KAK0566417.1 hypothetical protein OC844_000745 [Tilletia horrida]